MKKRFMYKKINKLTTNALYSFKVLQFKRKKWGKFLWYFKNQIKPSKYNKYKVIDQARLLIDKKNKLELNFKNSYYKKYFIVFKIFSLFFGKLTKKFYKNYKQKLKNFKILFLLESRLDFVLYRSKICSSIKLARQLIIHGFIFVNKMVVKNKSFILKPGDLISFNCALIKKYKFNLILCTNWPLPATQNLIINYKTFEIIFLGNLNIEKNFIFFYPFYFKLYKIFN